MKHSDDIGHDWKKVQERLGVTTEWVCSKCNSYYIDREAPFRYRLAQTMSGDLLSCEEIQTRRAIREVHES